MEYTKRKAIDPREGWFVQQVDKWGFERIIARCSREEWAERIVNALNQMEIEG